MGRGSGHCELVPGRALKPRWRKPMPDADSVFCFQAEDGIRDLTVTGVQTCALPILTRIKTPWVLGPVEWTPELTERAVVWLAEQTGKAILKLTARDYTEHHLSPLLSKYGAAGPINGTIFNSLRDKIRGRRKLPTRKSVVVFSPHPDDDVISMGGLLRKLWENENATVVAYMTSGNIAVFDHDVRRHLDFVERAASTLGLDRAAAQRVLG